MILLEDRTIIAVTGADSAKFLQGIISNNMEQVSENKAIFTALLNPQGKFLHDFFVIKANNKLQIDADLLIDVESRQVELLLATLHKYKLRSKVQFQTHNELCVYAGFGEYSINQDYLIFTDPRHVNMGARIIAKSPITTTASLFDYHHHRISNLIPEGWHDMIYEKSFLLENNYDAINAIDFTKGCYVGQEVTARAKYRGEVRKRIYMVKGEVLPPFACEITSQSGVILGQMRSSTNNFTPDTPHNIDQRNIAQKKIGQRNIGLAQLRIAEVQTAISNNELIIANGNPLTINHI